MSQAGRKVEGAMEYLTLPETPRGKEAERKDITKDQTPLHSPRGPSPRGEELEEPDSEIVEDVFPEVICTPSDRIDSRIGTTGGETPATELDKEEVATDYETNWLLYSWWAQAPPGANVFLYGLFLDHLLRQEACQHLGDENLECDDSWNVVRHIGTGEELTDYRLTLGGIVPESITMVIVSISVLTQGIAYFYYGPMADYEDNRYNLFMWHTDVGAFVTFLMVGCIWSWTWPIMAFLTIVVHVFKGTQNVFRMAYIPVITENHHSLQKHTNESVFNSELQKFQDDLWGRIIMLYNVSALISLIVTGIWLGYAEHINFTSDEQRNLSLGLCCAFYALWWYLFTIPAKRRMKVRPGPPLPPEARTVRGQFRFSLRRYKDALKRTKEKSNLYTLMIIIIIFLDGVSTVQNTVVLFAEREVGLTETEIIIMFVLLYPAGIVGTALLPKVYGCFGLSPIARLGISTFFCGFVCFWGLIGFLDVGFGFVTKTEMMLFPMIYSFFGANMMAQKNSLLTYLMPKNQEAELFALIEVVENGTSFFGPLIVSVFTQLVDIRFGMGMISIIIWVPLLFLGRVDIEEGRKQARPADDYGSTAGSKREYAEAVATLAALADSDSMRAPSQTPATTRSFVTTERGQTSDEESLGQSSAITRSSLRSANYL